MNIAAVARESVLVCVCGGGREDGVWGSQAGKRMSLNCLKGRLDHDSLKNVTNLSCFNSTVAVRSAPPPPPPFVSVFRLFFFLFSCHV